MTRRVVALVRAARVSPAALIALLVMLFACARVALAQDPAPVPTPATIPGVPPMDVWSLLRSMELLALPFLTSLVTQWVKLGVTWIPDKALPFIAPLLAVCVNGASQALLGINLTPVDGAMGSAAAAAVIGGPGAVYMNQAVKQLRKPADDPQQADQRKS